MSTVTPERGQDDPKRNDQKAFADLRQHHTRRGIRRIWLFQTVCQDRRFKGTGYEYRYSDRKQKKPVWQKSEVCKIQI